jgi:hypothetical protein
MGNASSNLLGKHEGKTPLVRRTCRWEEMIMKNLKETM